MFRLGTYSSGRPPSPYEQNLRSTRDALSAYPVGVLFPKTAVISTSGPGHCQGALLYR